MDSSATCNSILPFPSDVCYALTGLAIFLATATSCVIICTMNYRFRRKHQIQLLDYQPSTSTRGVKGGLTAFREQMHHSPAVWVVGPVIMAVGDLVGAMIVAITDYSDASSWVVDFGSYFTSFVELFVIVLVATGTALSMTMTGEKNMNQAMLVTWCVVISTAIAVTVVTQWKSNLFDSGKLVPRALIGALALALVPRGVGTRRILRWRYTRVSGGVNSTIAYLVFLVVFNLPAMVAVVQFVVLWWSMKRGDGIDRNNILYNHQYVECAYCVWNLSWELLVPPVTTYVAFVTAERYVGSVYLSDGMMMDKLLEKASRGTAPEIKESEITMLKRLAVGGYGEVYMARWQSTLVAVKRCLVVTHGQMSIIPEEESLTDITNELAVLSSSRHPNILLFLGVVKRGKFPDLVMEWMGGGSVFDFIHARTEPLPWDMCVRIALGAARGMEYLHNHDVVHRDLKSCNVLLDSSIQAVKIADFGLSRFTDVVSTATARYGTLQWTAPEVLNGAKATRAADVYSFGVIMWELATRKVPFSDLIPGGPVIIAIHRIVTVEGFTLPLSDGCPPGYARLVRLCGQLDPLGRPSFAEVAAELEALAELLGDAVGPNGVT